MRMLMAKQNPLPPPTPFFLTVKKEKWKIKNGFLWDEKASPKGSVYFHQVKTNVQISVKKDAKK